MSRRPDDAKELARTLVAVAMDEGVTFLAAAVAYYAFVSLVPLALLVVAVATTVGGPELAERIVATADRFLTPEAESVVRDALTAGEGRGAATVVGLVVFLWGGLKVFRGLDRAFSQVYGTLGEDSFVQGFRDATVVLAAIGAGLLAVGVLGEVVRRSVPLFPDAVALVTLLVSLGVVLFPLYYVFPDRPIPVREALPGTVFAAFGWTLLEALFRAYVETVGSSSVYGLLGGALLLLTWMYFGATVVILGAVVNATVAGHRVRTTEDRQLQHPGRRQGRPEPMCRDEDADAGDRETPTPADGPSTSRSGSGDPDGESDDGDGGDSGPGSPPVTDGGRPVDDESPDGADDADGSPDGDDGDDGPTDEGDEVGDGDDGTGVDDDGTDPESTPDEDPSDDEGGPGGDPSGDESGPDEVEIGSSISVADVGPDRSAGDDGPGGGDDGSGGGDGESDGGQGAGDPGDGGPGGPDDGHVPGPDDGVRSELDRLWEELEGVESRLDEKTVSRSDFESEMRAYVRRRIRRGHARGWGPYLVLLYGTAMTLGAFYYLEGLWAILAMIVLWLSTLGLYTLMLIVGVGIGLLSTLGRARGLAGKVRSEE